MAQFKLKRMSRQVGLRRCGGCQIFPAAQFLLNAFNGLVKHLGLCERTRVVSSGLGSPWVSFSTHFAFLSGSNILGSIAGSPQALSQTFNCSSEACFIAGGRDAFTTSSSAALRSLASSCVRSLMEFS
jgi:hypothetical protein